MDNKQLVSGLNVCFVANFYKTILYQHISENLKKFGIISYWIVLKSEQYKQLCDLYGTQKVLLINRKYFHIDNDPLCDIKINEILFGDRVLKYDKKSGLKFLRNIQKPIYNFIKENNIRYVFGERTWGHEIVISRLVERFPALQCSYISFTSIRIPGERFAFFRDEQESVIVETRAKECRDISSDFRIEKPAYLSINDKIIKKNSSIWGRLKRIKRFITNENIEKSDPNVIISMFWRFYIPAREEVNREMYKLVNRVDFNIIKDKKYIFFGFHKQPESSIDVLGRYFDDQFQNVINIWKILPSGWILVIKEHTNAIGDRGILFYNKILKYPNIFIVNEKTDSHQIIKNSQVVFTVSGTIALEAALLEVPSITLVPTFFNKLNYCRHLNWVDIQRYFSIIDIINETRLKPNNIEEYKKYIMENSFEGNPTDVYTSPDVLNENNIGKIVNAFLQLLD